MDGKPHQNRLIVLSLFSLPLAWILLQGYQFWLARPIGNWILTEFSQLFAHFYIAKPAHFGASLFNLVIFGTIASIWPDIGFGTHWKPNRQQGLVVFGLVAASILYPIVNSVLEYETPVRQLGFVVWTITPVQEEILFRGLIYTLLLRLFHQTPHSSWREIFPALVLGAAWFSLWHISPQAAAEYGWGLIGVQAVLTFFAGLLFNALRHWTGSIWLLIPVHAAGNFMVSIM